MSKFVPSEQYYLTFAGTYKSGRIFRVLGDILDGDADEAERGREHFLTRFLAKKDEFIQVSSQSIINPCEIVDITIDIVDVRE